MKTISINIYSFNELSEEAKNRAIENVRNTYYEYNDFASWAIDDCALFEPKEKELIELFREDYKFPLIENTRESIYFDTDINSYLDCEKAMEITNEKQFLLWLGLTEEIINGVDFSFNIFTPNYRNADTTIDFNGFDSKFDEVIYKAQNKFQKHIQGILERIKADIDYRFTDEYIEGEIIENEMEFLSCGKIYKN